MYTRMGRARGAGLGVEEAEGEAAGGCGDGEAVVE
jgi:hypothetical protein